MLKLNFKKLFILKVILFNFFQMFGLHFHALVIIND